MRKDDRWSFAQAGQFINSLDNRLESLAMRQLVGFLLAVVPLALVSMAALNFGSYRHAAEFITALVSIGLVVAVVLAMTGSERVRRVSIVFVIAVIATRCFSETASPILLVIDALILQTFTVGVQAQTVFSPEVNELWQCLRVLDSLWVGLLAAEATQLIASYSNLTRLPRPGGKITVSLRQLFVFTAYAAFLAMIYRQPQGWLIVVAQAVTLFSIVAAAIYVSLSATLRSPIGVWLVVVLILMIFVPVSAYLPLAELLKPLASKMLPNPNSVVFGRLQELGQATIPPLAGALAVMLASALDRARQPAPQSLGAVHEAASA